MSLLKTIGEYAQLLLIGECDREVTIEESLGAGSGWERIVREYRVTELYRWPYHPVQLIKGDRHGKN